MSDGKIALITGATSGIGRNTAEAFIEAGYRVVVTGRRKELLDEVVANCSNDDALACAADLTDPAAVDDMFAQLEKKFGRLDVLFNNAGNNVPATSFGDLSFDDWKKVIDVNLNGAFLAANRAFRMMSKHS
jgi:NAD(P)-dependent dehydrogenase (short-subunit alcohol dehydrogenase family)